MLDKRLAGMTPHSRSLIGSTAEAFKSQKATHAKELEHELGRYTKTMLHDGVYSHRDVETLLSSFFTALQGTIQRELRSQTNVSAELLVQLFQCAHAKSLSLDPPRVCCYLCLFILLLVQCKRMLFPTTDPRGSQRHNAGVLAEERWSLSCKQAGVAAVRDVRRREDQRRADDCRYASFP